MLYDDAARREMIGEESNKASMGGTKAGVTTNSPLLLILVFVISLLSCLQRTICCVQAERLSLLDFKAGLHDPYNTLASWVGQDCCQWNGVECSNRTAGDVIFLDLFDASLGGEIRPSLLGLKHLGKLRLGGNNFQGITIPTFIASLNKLEYLGLSDSGFSGLIPYQLGNLSSLQYLLLSSMDSSNHLLYMDSSQWLSNLSSLQSLHLGGVDLSKADGWLESLNSLPSLSVLSLDGAELGDSFPLHLSHVNLTSLRLLGLASVGMNSIPSWLFQIPGLEYLDLGFNKLQNLIPDSIGNLTSLRSLDLSYNGHIIEIPATFGKLCMLSGLLLSGNYYDADKFNELGETLTTTGCIKDSLELLECWDSNLTGRLPDWLWEFKNLKYLGLSNNSLSGTVNIDKLMSHMTYLSVSTNHINGSIPVSICSNLKNLVALDFSKNHLSGEIPNCWDSNIGLLEVMDLSNNNLSGDIPTSIGSIPSLQSLHLNGNHLSGNLPLTLRNCTEMRILDLGQNMFTGTIPTWIGQTMPQLQVLRLRSNLFFGNIPPQLGHLKYLQFVDLALNNLSGTIPHSFADLRAIKVGTIPHTLAETRYNIIITTYTNPLHYFDKIDVIMKGREDEYAKLLPFLFSIDLAGNSLTGAIPKELTTLHRLQNLNLSRNHLTGTITEKIAELQSLESLDLSNNSLSGAIPSSMTAMHFLTVLNLSFNKFSGKIPSGGQLDALPNPDIYIGNQELCGFPLNKKCQYNGPSQPPQQLKTDSKMVEFYLSIGLGFVVSYLLFWGTLIVKNKWRTAYFRFVDDMFDLVYVALAINKAILKSKWNSLYLFRR